MHDVRVMMMMIMVVVDFFGIMATVAKERQTHSWWSTLVDKQYSR